MQASAAFSAVEVCPADFQIGRVVTQRQQLGGGVIAGIADAVAGLPAGHGRANGDDGAGRAVTGTEGKFPVGQVGVFEPLMRACVHSEFRAGTDGADLGGNEDLVWSGAGNSTSRTTTLKGSNKTAWRAFME